MLGVPAASRARRIFNIMDKNQFIRGLSSPLSVNQAFRRQNGCSGERMDDCMKNQIGFVQSLEYPTNAIVSGQVAETGVRLVVSEVESFSLGQ